MSTTLIANDYFIATRDRPVLVFARTPTQNERTSVKVMRLHVSCADIVGSEQKQHTTFPSCFAVLVWLVTSWGGVIKSSRFYLLPTNFDRRTSSSQLYTLAYALPTRNKQWTPPLTTTMSS
eukprot:scaffold11897_cov118-Skeletonema_marinoi.AAC.1